MPVLVTRHVWINVSVVIIVFGVVLFLWVLIVRHNDDEMEKHVRKFKLGRGEKLLGEAPLTWRGEPHCLLLFLEGSYSFSLLFRPAVENIL